MTLSDDELKQRRADAIDYCGVWGLRHADHSDIGFIDEIIRLRESNRLLSEQYLAMSKTSAAAASENRKLRDDKTRLLSRLKEVVSLIDNPCPYDHNTTMAVARQEIAKQEQSK